MAAYGTGLFYPETIGSNSIHDSNDSLNWGLSFREGLVTLAFGK